MAFFGKKTLKDFLENFLSTAEVDSESALQTAAEQVYIKELALYTAIGLLADIICKCERQVFRDGKQVHDNLWYTLNVSANVNQTAAELFMRIVVDMYYKGHALVFPLSNKGLFIADSYSRTEYPVKGDTFESIVVGDMNVKKTFRAPDVYYFTQSNKDIRKLIDSVFQSYADLLAAAASSYQRGSGEKYVLTLGQYPNQKAEEQEKYMEQVKKRLDPFINNSSAVYPATKDQKLERLSAGNTSSNSSDFSSLRKEVYDIVASVLHIPVGLLDGNITSVDQVVNQTLTFAVGPLAHKISMELTRKSFTPEEVMQGGCKVSIDTSKIRNIDIMANASQLYQLVGAGIHSVDEIRELVGLNDLDVDWSTEHYITKNFTTVENLMEGGEET